MPTPLPDAPLTFVLPEGSERPSGGNLYNRNLLAALAALTPIRRISVAEWRGELDAGTPGLFFLDSLDLSEAPRLDGRRPGQFFGLIVHHLPSLEPDLPSSDPALGAESAALARFDVFLCTSPFTSELLHERGFSPERLFTVPPAPPVARASARRYEPPLRALLVANLIPRKGVLPFFEALATRAETAEFRLTVVGRDDLDAAYAGACRAALASSPYLAARVRIEAAVPHERMREYYEVSDLLVSAAAIETFGMALQEARAHGLPMLVRDGGFARRHVDEGANGRVVSDVAALAGALAELAREPSGMRELFAGAQRTRPAADYGWREAAERLLVGLGR